MHQVARAASSATRPIWCRCRLESGHPHNGRPISPCYGKPRGALAGRTAGAICWNMTGTQTAAPDHLSHSGPGEAPPACGHALLAGDDGNTPHLAFVAAVRAIRLRARNTNAAGPDPGRTGLPFLQACSGQRAGGKPGQRATTPGTGRGPQPANPSRAAAAACAGHAGHRHHPGRFRHGSAASEQPHAPVRRAPRWQDRTTHRPAASLGPCPGDRGGSAAQRQEAHAPVRSAGRIEADPSKHNLAGIAARCPAARSSCTCSPATRHARQPPPRWQHPMHREAERSRGAAAAAGPSVCIGVHLWFHRPSAANGEGAAAGPPSRVTAACQEEDATTDAHRCTRMLGCARPARQNHRERGRFAGDPRRVVRAAAPEPRAPERRPSPVAVGPAVAGIRQNLMHREPQPSAGAACPAIRPAAPRPHAPERPRATRPEFSGGSQTPCTISAWIAGPPASRLAARLPRSPAPPVSPSTARPARPGGGADDGTDGRV